MGQDPGPFVMCEQLQPSDFRTVSADQKVTVVIPPGRSVTVEARTS
jgi:hypothetical protein